MLRQYTSKHMQHSLTQSHNSQKSVAQARHVHKHSGVFLLDNLSQLNYMNNLLHLWMLLQAF